MTLRGLSSVELTAQETVVLPAAAPLQLSAGMRRYEDAFKMAQPLTIDLPCIQDQTVRLQVLEKNSAMPASYRSTWITSSRSTIPAAKPWADTEDGSLVEA